MSRLHQNKRQRERAGLVSKGKKKRSSDPRSRFLPPLQLSTRLLRAWALPQPSETDDKEGRGRVLVVGGSPEMPGAVILAATAALRAGCGKLQIATCRSIAPVVGAVVPEARVCALPETKAGGMAVSGATTIARLACAAQAVLIGPGMLDETAINRLMKALLTKIAGPTVVLDAGALSCLTQDERCLVALKSKVVLTPHAGEMAMLTGLDKSEIELEPLSRARESARRFQAVIALKGAETFIAGPTGGKTYCNHTGNVGLATSGSGDVLSGIIAGLAARGAAPLQAASWGVYLHGRAGEQLARKVGRLGFLARELLAEIPLLLSEMDGRKKR